MLSETVTVCKMQKWFTDSQAITMFNYYNNQMKKIYGDRHKKKKLSNKNIPQFKGLLLC